MRLEQLPNSAIQQVAALFSQSLCFTLQHMQYLGCSAPICTLAFGRSSFRCIGAVSPQQQKAAKRRRVLEGPSLNFMFAALSKLCTSRLARSEEAADEALSPILRREADYQASCFWAVNTVLHPMLQHSLISETKSWARQLSSGTYRGGQRDLDANLHEDGPAWLIADACIAVPVLMVSGCPEGRRERPCCPCSLLPLARASDNSACQLKARASPGMVLRRFQPETTVGA